MGYWGSIKTLKLCGNQESQGFMGAQGAPQKMQISRCNIKSGFSWFPDNKTQFPEFSAPKLLHCARNSSHHEFPCRFQEPMSRAEHAYVVDLLHFVLVEGYSVSNSPLSTAINLRLIISVLPCTWRLTALLFKKIHLHLHGDTLTYTTCAPLHSGLSRICSVRCVIK